MRSIAEAIGQGLGLPVRQRRSGGCGQRISVGSRLSSRSTIRPRARSRADAMGWQPQEIGLLTGIRGRRISRMN